MERVDFELAKLLKEVGYGEDFTGTHYVEGYIDRSDELDGSEVDFIEFQQEDGIREDLYFAPYLEEAQKWLRENYNIYLTIFEYYRESVLPLSDLLFPQPEGFFCWDNYDDNFCEAEAVKFNTYEKALSYGLKYHINKYIKNKL